jgi:hypothetical protein
MARKKLTVKRKGYWRKGYTRKNGTKVKKTWVPATTFKVTDRGAKGRGPKVIEIKDEGGLGGPGFTRRTMRGRRRILARVARGDGYATAQRRLSAIRGLGSLTMSKTKREQLQRDANWLKKNYGGK